MINIPQFHQFGVCIIIAVGITEVFISETIILYTLQVQILALVLVLVRSIPKYILRVTWDLIQV